jgi:hypothetical protein
MSLSPEAKRGGLNLLKMVGTLHRVQEQLHANYKSLYDVFNKTSHEEKVRFQDRANSGEAQSTPALDKLAKAMHAEFKPITDAIQKLAPGLMPDEYLREYYFGRRWKQASEETLTKYHKSIAGSPAFLKQQKLDSIAHGESMGRELISDNPVDNHVAKIMETQKLLSALQMMDKSAKEGLAKIFVTDENMAKGLKKRGYDVVTEIPPDFTDIQNKSYTGKWIEGKKVGHYIFQKDFAQVIDNHLSKGIRDIKLVGPLYDYYMRAGNTLNLMQLTGAYHLGTISVEAYGQKTAHAVNRFFRLATLKDTDPRHFIEAVAELYKGPAKYFKDGLEVQKEWLKAGASGNANIALTTELMEQAGAQMRYSEEFRTKWKDSMLKSFNNGELIRGALKSPFALAETITRPTMESFVPLVKAGVFNETMHEWIRTHPGADHNAVRTAAKEIWSHTDRIMGEVAYDRLFANKIALNAVQGTVRAPGWTFGNIGTMIKAPVDAVKFLKEWIQTGKAPEQLPDSVAYTIGIAVTAATINALMTAMLTRSKPTGMDYVAFRDGGVDADGKPTRLVLPWLFKDVYSYFSGSAELAKVGDYKSIPGQLVRDIATTAGHKANPMMTSIGEGISGKNYFNEEQSLAQAGIKAFTPFSITQMGRNYEQYKRGDSSLYSVALPVIGANKAGHNYMDSIAERTARELALSHYPQSTIDADTAALRKAKREADSYVRKGEQLPDELINRLVTLGGANVSIVRKTAFETSFQKHFARLNIQEALIVMKRATSDEKETLVPMLKQKAINAGNKGTPISDKEWDSIIGYLEGK